MKKVFIISCLILFSLLVSSVYGQSKDDATHPSAPPAKEDTTLIRPQKSVTQGTVIVEGKKIDYQAIAGTLILKDKKDKPTCSMFYVAYFKSNEVDQSQRPVTFIYNGGPGSSTVWLHLGAWGPRRVNAADTARNSAPFKMVNNDYSLLDASDLVFIDAPGTGFSKLIDKDNGGAGDPKDFFGIDQDGHAFTSFITQFLTTYNRWESPKYLFGESYGTLRSAILSYYLGNEGVDLNGVILLSQILSFENITDLSEVNPGNDLPYQLVLPSMAATAWYHQKLPHQPEKLEPLLTVVRNFATTDYAQALSKGALLDTTTFSRIAERLHEYTGLPISYIRKANLRVNGPDFEKTLLTDGDRITGRLDSRFSGYSVDPLAKTPDYDPMEKAVSSIFIASANNYLHTTLKFGMDKTYQAFGDIGPGGWDFRHAAPGSPFKFVGNVMPDLAHAMIYNPKMKVMLNMGYFDLGTPFFGGEYEMHHLPMPAALQKNISYAYYESGHMVYLNIPSLKKLHDNTAKFIEETH